jgi:hypothetical protein
MSLQTAIRSAGAGLAGIIVGAGLSVGTDAVLEAAGVLPRGNLYVAAWLIWAVLLYRSVYNVVGSYLVARLAPNHPMGHVLALGALGTVVCIAGAIATADRHLGPGWYAWTLAALNMPAAWIGGRLYTGGRARRPRPVESRLRA